MSLCRTPAITGTVTDIASSQYGNLTYSIVVGT
jgi:hypothetical protein